MYGFRIVELCAENDCCLCYVAAEYIHARTTNSHIYLYIHTFKKKNQNNEKSTIVAAIVDARAPNDRFTFQ